MTRKILIGLAILLVVIQFIRPTRNISTATGPNEISLHYAVPDQVKQILKTSCYNCHSNNTEYPWYVNLQPVGWWLQNHVSDGKRHLNFDEFGSYAEKRAKKKFDEIVDEVSEEEMPLPSYLLIHGEAKLTPEQSSTLVAWAKALK